MPRLPESFLTIEMLNGQTFQFHSRPGMAVHVLSGHIHLAEAPRWLAEEVYQVPRYLRSGDFYTMQEEGWSTLYAVGGTELRCIGFHEPRSLSLALWNRLKAIRLPLRWYGWLRQTVTAATSFRL